jgi:hypothetical protein
VISVELVEGEGEIAMRGRVDWSTPTRFGVLLGPLAPRETFAIIRMAHRFQRRRVMNAEPRSEPLGTEPAIESKVRAIRDAEHLTDDAKSVETLWVVLQWLDERRMLDEEGVVVWEEGPSGRVVAEGRRRLVRTTGQYGSAQVPTSREVTATALFVELGATALGVVRQLQADLPHHAPRDVVEGLAALERSLSGSTPAPNESSRVQARR